MTRDPALISLSHEHHHGLRWSRSLREDTPDLNGDSLLEFLDEFFHAWETELNPHFRKEEDYLLPLFATEGDSWSPAIQEMLKQHIVIRRDVLLLREDPNTEVIRRLGDLLHNHVRLEEREVFPQIENQASDELLEKIRIRLNEGDTPA